MALAGLRRMLSARMSRNAFGLLLILFFLKVFVSWNGSTPTYTKVASSMMKSIQAGQAPIHDQNVSSLSVAQAKAPEKPSVKASKEVPAKAPEKTPTKGTKNTTAKAPAKPPPKPPAKPKGRARENNPWARAIYAHLDEHKMLCEKEWQNRSLPPGSKPLCDCVPKTLVSWVNVTFNHVPLNETEKMFPDVQAGHWEPENCTARSRLVVIIPFRDRQMHLEILLRYLHPVLQGQQLNYTILVPEQLSPKIFNKASLMNVGFEYAMNVHQPDCVVFHDVDHIPEDGRHFYYCRKSPIHLGAFHSRHGYRLIYGNIFGAVTAFKPEQFMKVNGFSNRFFGWGGEDDDMSIRVRENKFPMIRDPRAVAGYKVITHKRDKGNRNPNRGAMIRRLYRDRDSKFDGLNSLRYVFSRRVAYKLYEWFGADLLNEETKIGFNLNEAS